MNHSCECAVRAFEFLQSLLFFDRCRWAEICRDWFHDHHYHYTKYVFLTPNSYSTLTFLFLHKVIMQLRIKALYGKTVSLLITILWVLEVIAVVGLGVASLVAIDGMSNSFPLSCRS